MLNIFEIKDSTTAAANGHPNKFTDNQTYLHIQQLWSETTSQLESCVWYGGKCEPNIYSFSPLGLYHLLGEISSSWAAKWSTLFMNESVCSWVWPHGVQWVFKKHCEDSDSVKKKPWEHCCFIVTIENTDKGHFILQNLLNFSDSFYIFWWFLGD